MLSFHSDVLTQTPRKAVILGCAPVANLLMLFSCYDLSVNLF